MMRLEDVGRAINSARRRLEEEDEEREKLLKLTREVIRHSREAIGRIHQDDLDEAVKALKAAREIVGRIRLYRESHPKLYFSGYVTSALTEYVEATLLINHVRGASLPTFTELGVEPAVYLLGLCDFTGELRRFIVHCINRGLYKEAQDALTIMEKIYLELSKIIVPDALVPGFRRKIDVMRIVLENTVNDLLYHSTTHRVVEVINNLLETLK